MLGKIISVVLRGIIVTMCGLFIVVMSGLFIAIVIVHFIPLNQRLITFFILWIMSIIFIFALLASDSSKAWKRFLIVSAILSFSISLAFYIFPIFEKIHYEVVWVDSFLSGISFSFGFIFFLIFSILAGGDRAISDDMWQSGECEHDWQYDGTGAYGNTCNSCRKCGEADYAPEDLRGY